MKDPLQVLQSYWGYSQFREKQDEIVHAVLNGKDCLALLPTGGGKSICFQVPALCTEGICIVISPLIALMKDQVYNLNKRGIEAYALYTGMHIKEIDRILDNCIYGKVKFLYVSPERLETELFTERLKQMKVNLIAVDESHCISQWGYDFRPSYLQVAEIRTLLPSVPVLALTATATPEVVIDIQKKLNFSDKAIVVQKSFSRSNLTYTVIEEDDKKTKLIQLLHKTQGSSIVYVQNRKETKDIAYLLQQRGISASYYHAGLGQEERSKIQDEWIQNNIRVIVATNAFGMGIDKPDVRWVFHLSLPESLEAYFQEAGRAGRDEKRAYAILLYNQHDRIRLETHFKAAYPTNLEIQTVYRALSSYFQLATGSGLGQSFEIDLIDFTKKFNLTVPLVLSSLKILEISGYLHLSESIFKPSTLMMKVDSRTAYDFMLKNKKLEPYLQYIVRNHQGIFQHPAAFYENQFIKKFNISTSELQQILFQLQQIGFIEYKSKTSLPLITYLLENLNPEHLTFDQNKQNFLKERSKKRIEAAIHYAENIFCRSVMLLDYFGEKKADKCGSCDYCSGRYEKPNAEELKTIKQSIKISLLKKQMDLKELLSQYSTSLDLKVVFVVQHLSNQGFIKKNEKNQLHWID